MVPAVDGVASLSPGPVADSSTFAETTPQPCSAPSFSVAEPARGFVQQQLAADAGLSVAAIDLVLANVSDSTNKVYVARWRKFVSWCRGNSVHPLSPTPAQVANYLAECFNAGARYSTVRGCLSAVAHTLRLKPGLQSLGTHPLVTAIFPAMRRADIKKRPDRNLEWDLNLVLEDLAALDDTASVVMKTYKALFLLAFASGARVSELAALQTPLFFTEEGVTIPFDPIFIPKRACLGKAPGPLNPLQIQCLPVEYASICPVQALRLYAALHVDRPAGSRLWVAPKGAAVVTPRHIAAWLRAVIAGAYRRAQEKQPASFTPHSVRAAAASWAWKNNVPLPTILKQCRWSHQSTFTTFYLRRLADTDGLVSRFKPLALAALV